MTDIAETITQITKRIPQIVVDADTAEAAHAAEVVAHVTLLDRVVALVRPALRALSTRPLVSSRWSNGQNGLHPWEKHTRAAWRGIYLGEYQSGPVEKTCGDENTGTYAGQDLFLAEDGTWRRLRYSGSWSRWQGSTSGWESTEQTLSTRDVVGKYDAEKIISAIGAVVAEAGSREAATHAAKERAAKISALVTLL